MKQGKCIALLVSSKCVFNNHSVFCRGVIYDPSGMTLCLRGRNEKMEREFLKDFSLIRRTWQKGMLQ